MTWHLLSESHPPFGSDNLLYEPSKDGDDPFIWQVNVRADGSIMFFLPWDQVSRSEGYSEKDNLEYMKEILGRCTHWAKTFDVVSLPTTAVDE